MTQKVWDGLKRKIRLNMDRLIVKTGYDGHSYGSDLDGTRRLLAAQLLCEGMTVAQRKAVFGALPENWV